MSWIDALQPLDESNQQLREAVRPSGWINPQPMQPYHLVVIGAGTAGLVTAAGAAGLGARVALVERGMMGGDCLNVGCVPSKALLSAARRAAAVRDADRWGVNGGTSAEVDFSFVMERMRKLRAGISHHDSVERFTGLGVDVYLGQARFIDGQIVEVEHAEHGTRRLEFRKAVLATGARAAAPPIPGLDKVAYRTNETLFSLTELPGRLGVIGGGPIGVEMAQAFARLGSQVTLLEKGERILSREDAEPAQQVARQMIREGVQILTNASIGKIHAGERDEMVMVGTGPEGNWEVSVDELLVAAGRAPNVEDLNLDSIGVQYDRRGVKVNAFLQTTVPSIYAAGDVVGRFQFTHAADFMARIVIQNALFALGPFGRRKVDDLVIPWATYTSPEVATVGLNQQTAEERGVAIDTFTQDLGEVDRAILEGEAGRVTVHVRSGTDQIVGATIVAENAGDLISEITLAMTNRIGLGKIAATIHPYPTVADAIRRIGDQYNRTRLTPWSRRLLGVLRRWNVGK